MPSLQQRRTFQAVLLAFLRPHYSALPEHNPLRSASISRFLNHYPWPTRKLVRLSREVMLEWLLEASKYGRHRYLKVIIVTCVEKTGRILGLGSINAMNGKTGLHLVVLYLELNQVRSPWNFRVWNGKDTASPMKLGLRMLLSLSDALTEHSRAQVVVLADAWFASNACLKGIHDRGFRAVVAIREDRPKPRIGL